MGSKKDPINAKANQWLHGGKARPSATASPARGSRLMSAQIQRLAKRLGRSPEDVAANIPADSLRRSKYPAIEVKNPDGTRTYKHDQQVSEGVTPLVSR